MFDKQRRVSRGSKEPEPTSDESVAQEESEVSQEAPAQEAAAPATEPEEVEDAAAETKDADIEAAEAGVAEKKTAETKAAEALEGAIAAQVVASTAAPVLVSVPASPTEQTIKIVIEQPPVPTRKKRTGLKVLRAVIWTAAVILVILLALYIAAYVTGFKNGNGWPILFSEGENQGMLNWLSEAFRNIRA